MCIRDRDMTNYIIKPLGEMYMEEVTADDIRLALVPLSKKSEGLYNKVNMLQMCIRDRYCPMIHLGFLGIGKQ